MLPGIIPFVAGAAAVGGGAPVGTAFGTITNLGTGSDPGPSGSRAVINVTANVGDLVVVIYATANSGASGAAISISVSDTSTEAGAANVYTQRLQVNYSPGGVANDGITLTFFTSVLTRAITADNINASFSPSSAQGNAVAAIGFRPSAGKTASYVGAAPSGVTGNSANPQITTNTILNGETVVCAMATEGNATTTGDSDTNDGTWSSLYGVTSSGTTDAGQVRTQHKFLTADSTQIWNPTLSAAQDHALGYIVIKASL